MLSYSVDFLDGCAAAQQLGRDIAEVIERYTDYRYRQKTGAPSTQQAQQEITRSQFFYFRQDGAGALLPAFVRQRVACFYQPDSFEGQAVIIAGKYDSAQRRLLRPMGFHSLRHCRRGLARTYHQAPSPGTVPDMASDAALMLFDCKRPR